MKDSCTVSHFSKYMIVDRHQWYESRDFHNHYYECDYKGLADKNNDFVYYYNYEKPCKRVVSEPISYIWLISKVRGNAIYDTKRKNKWNYLMQEVNSSLPFFHAVFPFVFLGDEINAENFGNIFYGYIDHAGGFSSVELIAGGSAYSILDSGSPDNFEDMSKVAEGYRMYSHVENDYYYIHK